VFTGKTAIVTGAGSGIGRAIAHAMAKRNANTILVDINLESGEKVSKEIESLGDGRSLALKADVSNVNEVQKVVENVLREFGRIDILVNNAAIGGPAVPITELREEDWDEVIKVDLKSVFLFCKAVIGHMIERKYGKIINITSLAGKAGNPNLVAYSAAKAGVIGLSRSLALWVATMGINVNSVAAGTTETPMLGSMPWEQREALRNKIPMGRFSRPEETAAVVCFLASDEASFVTGQCINATGGRAYD
jgi:NAD(P)-dependent dehydrogenase (short-subunit alcohol dehydrogenase family)